jgi:hypothetical protein
MRAVRKLMAVLVMSAGMTAVVVATAPPGGAAPGHTSCQALGALTVSEAQAKTLAPELRALPRGTVDDLIAVVQVGGTFGGEQVPAFCVPK